MQPLRRACSEVLHASSLLLLIAGRGAISIAAGVGLAKRAVGGVLRGHGLISEGGDGTLAVQAAESEVVVLHNGAVGADDNEPAVACTTGHKESEDPML
jgi:hypothetical protein